jgi:HEAT repeat protein
MKKRMLLLVVASMALVAAGILIVHRRQSAGQAGQANTGNVTTQAVSEAAPQEEAAPESPDAAGSGIPTADWEDYKRSKDTSEYKATFSELVELEKRAEARGNLTTNEAATLIAYMQSPHYNVRSAALIGAALGHADPAKSMVMPYVVKLLHDRVSLTRMWAAHAMGILGDKADIPYLEPLVNDKSEHVAKHARMAISKLQQKGDNS